MSGPLVLDTDANQKTKSNQWGKLVLTRVERIDDFWQQLKDEETDILIIHLKNSEIAIEEMVSRFRSLRPDIPALLLLNDPKESDWAVLTDERIDVATSSVESNEVEQRINKLLRTIRPINLPSTGNVTRSEIYAEIHDQASGRLDAKCIANAFGLSVSELARSLKKEISTIHKTPNAVSLQDCLLPYSRIASALIRLTGSMEGGRIWLHAPNPHLDGIQPMKIIKGGKAEAIADLLEDAMLGHPS
ncbi:MAG: MbcA/ParS/Xre antitoxin family protein [Candidatus Obscuribacterales bacterium]|nr:MbcA/ParS/Xre antitoxin family protein [Candidatus Obscuribacterales bacterium]